MPALFPKWSNSAFRVGLGTTAAVVLVIVPTLLMGWVRTPYMRNMDQPLEQPVEFDHRHHVVDDRIDCRYCHTSVDDAPPAGMPGAGLCMNCHSQVFPTSPLLAPVRESAYTGRPLSWVRVDRLPDFVFFNHSAHVSSGVGCETCHGRVDLMPRIRQVMPLTMDWCVGCHRDPAPHLRPPDQVTTMGWEPRGASRTEIGRRIMAEKDLTPGTNCTTCHR